MNVKRTIFSLLCMVVFLFSSNAYALTPDLNVTIMGKEDSFLDMGHGEFKVDAGIQTLDTDKNKVKVKKLNSEVYEILDTTALIENKDYNKLVKVNEDTLLRVKELKINLLKSSQVEKYIDDYDINPIMAKDIRDRSNLAQQKDSEVDKELIIYTPNFSKKDDNTLASATGINFASLFPTTGTAIASLSRQSTYYYTGYNGENYKDEIWYGKSSPTYYKVRSGYTVKDYFNDTLNNFCEFGIGAVSDTLTSGAYSIAEIFFSSPVLTYPSNSGDVWQAALNESKWRKYTGIEMWDDVTDSYQYYTRAVSDRANTFFSHYLYRAYNGAKDYADDPTEAYIGDNYYSLDTKAYLYMYDLPYTEYIEEYSVNDYTFYTSQ